MTVRPDNAIDGRVLFYLQGEAFHAEVKAYRALAGNDARRPGSRVCVSLYLLTDTRPSILFLPLSTLFSPRIDHYCKSASTRDYWICQVIQ